MGKGRDEDTSSSQQFFQLSIFKINVQQVSGIEQSHVWKTVFCYFTGFYSHVEGVIRKNKHLSTFDPWTTGGLGAPTPCTVENPCIIFDTLETLLIDWPEALLIT